MNLCFFNKSNNLNNKNNFVVSLGGLQPEQNDKILLWRSDPEEYHPDENPLLEIEPDSGDGWVNTGQ